MRSFDALALALSATLASAQVYTCNGNRRPDWADCETVTLDFAMEGNQEVFHENGLDDPAPSCKWWYKNDGNCRITHCFQDTNPGTITGDGIFGLYDPIRSKCVDFRAGGEFTGALEFVNVYNDEDQAPAPPAAKTTVGANGITTGQSSLEDYLQWVNDTEAIQQTKRSNMRREDDAVTVDFTAFSVRNPNMFENGPRLGSGVGYTYEVSDTTSYGVTTSVNVGGAWSVFTASVGIETTYEETHTVTEGLTFDVNCPNQGQVVFWPLYDYYETTWSPSGNKVEIYVPVLVGDKKISGEIAISCLG